MFSHCYQSGNSIELFNSADKNLLSKWHFIGKHNKIFDPQIKCYEHILATGALSKMEIPGNRSYSYKFNPNKSLALFQSCSFSSNSNARLSGSGDSHAMTSPVTGWVRRIYVECSAKRPGSSGNSVP